MQGQVKERTVLSDEPRNPILDSAQSWLGLIGPPRADHTDLPHGEAFSRAGAAFFDGQASRENPHFCLPPTYYVRANIWSHVPLN
jgi:hypothetical protein